MKVNILEIRKMHGASEDVVHDGPLKLDDVRLEGPAHVALRLTNAASRILVRGTLKGKVLVDCARCAEPCALDVETDIDEEFLPASSPEVAEADESPWSDINVWHDDDREIDLTEILRQNVIAAIPIQPLCRKDCAGLCPICGENRNSVPCECKQKDVDPRLAPLLELQQRLKD
jgi:uncharacterized protein